MSVPTWKRRESPVLFIDNARDLVVHTLSCVRKFPKSSRIFIANDIMKLANDCYTYVVTANSRGKIKTIDDLNFRKQQFALALGCLESLDCKIGIAYETYTIKVDEEKYKNEISDSDYFWVHWGELISKEEALIHKVLASDEKSLENIG